MLVKFGEPFEKTGLNFETQKGVNSVQFGVPVKTFHTVSVVSFNVEKGLPLGERIGKGNQMKYFHTFKHQGKYFDAVYLFLAKN